MVYYCELGRCWARCSETLTYGCVCVELPPPDEVAKRYECTCTCILKSREKGEKKEGFNITNDAKICINVRDIPADQLVDFLSVHSGREVKSTDKRIMTYCNCGIILDDLIKELGFEILT